MQPSKPAINCILLFFTAIALLLPPTVATAAQATHLVVPGDTLWSICSDFVSPAGSARAAMPSEQLVARCTQVVVALNVGAHHELRHDVVLGRNGAIERGRDALRGDVIRPGMTLLLPGVGEPVPFAQADAKTAVRAFAGHVRVELAKEPRPGHLVLLFDTSGSMEYELQLLLGELPTLTHEAGAQHMTCEGIAYDGAQTRKAERGPCDDAFVARFAAAIDAQRRQPSPDLLAIFASQLLRLLGAAPDCAEPYLPGQEDTVRQLRRAVDIAKQDGGSAVVLLATDEPFFDAGFDGPDCRPSHFPAATAAGNQPRLFMYAAQDALTEAAGPRSTYRIGDLIPGATTAFRSDSAILPREGFISLRADVTQQ